MENCVCVCVWYDCQLCVMSVSLILKSLSLSLIGDIILSVNGVSIEGSTHQHIIELIRESTNMLK